MTTYLAGVDEVGRGCIFGPVIAAAVILGKYQNPELKDSKKLSPKKRIQLCNDIRRGASKVSIGEVSVEEIDNLNIKEASLLAMKRAILGLKKNNIEYDDLQESGYIYLQGGTPPLNNFQNNLKIDNKNYDNVPVGLMALDGQHMMEKERESVNGVFGLSYIGDNHNLKKYSILDKLLENLKVEKVNF